MQTMLDAFEILAESERSLACSLRGISHDTDEGAHLRERLAHTRATRYNLLGEVCGEGEAALIHIVNLLETDPEEGAAALQAMDDLTKEADEMGVKYRFDREDWRFVMTYSGSLGEIIDLSASGEETAGGELRITVVTEEAHTAATALRGWCVGAVDVEPELVS